jgi:hypothetical protein
MIVEIIIKNRSLSVDADALKKQTDALSRLCAYITVDQYKEILPILNMLDDMIRAMR